MKIHNFSAGPATMPPSVLAEAADSLREYDHTGVSFAEMSHRNPKFMAVIEEATALIKELLSLTADFEVIWVAGGASAQLAIAPMNLVSPRQSIAIVDTGFWSDRAIKAAAQLCKVHVLAWQVLRVLSSEKICWNAKLNARFQRFLITKPMFRRVHCTIQHRLFQFIPPCSPCVGQKHKAVWLRCKGEMPKKQHYCTLKLIEIRFLLAVL